MKKIIPQHILLIVRIYIIVLSFFSVFRLILFLSEFSRINDRVALGDIFYSFFMGLRFDIVISGYILILPFIILGTLSHINYKSRIIETIIFFYIFMMFSLAYLVCAIDIPYFNQFFSRFSVTAFDWFDSPGFVVQMIFQEPRYWIYIIPFGILTAVFYMVMKKSYHNEKFSVRPSSKPIIQVALSIIFLLVMMIGIRGRLEAKSPIRTGTAYFCNNPFLDQLGLNPNFTLIRSYLDSKKEENKSITLMDDQIAIANVRTWLNISGKNNDFPLCREIPVEHPAAIRHNVVVVIMESMSAAKMSRNGNRKHLTPFLDSISREGYYFENAYTAGIHTFNGIFSTLFSYPAIFRKHPMKGASIQKYNGMATTLREKNYSTIYFTTHDGQFDNVEGFLKANDFETVVSKKDYPSKEIKSILGVPDDYMFEFSIPRLNELNDAGNPFLAVYMTASDHGPYYIPEYFKSTATGIKDQVVEYADYSLRKFLRLAAKQVWFENTIFVFVADHGAPLDATYAMSLDYNHTPLVFYAPRIIKEKKVVSKMAGQIDIFPTIMGLLQLPYKNNNLGINLFTEERPYIFFNADDKFGVLDDQWFLIVNKDQSVSLYKYRTSDLHNYAGEQKTLVTKMKTYAESNLQAFQFVVKTNKQ